MLAVKRFTAQNNENVILMGTRHEGMKENQHTDAYSCQFSFNFARRRKCVFCVLFVVPSALCCLIIYAIAIEKMENWFTNNSSTSWILHRGINSILVLLMNFHGFGVSFAHRMWASNERSKQKKTELNLFVTFIIECKWTETISSCEYTVEFLLIVVEYIF